jgi:hypothetical protein
LDPAYHFDADLDADPDPACHFHAIPDADSDPTFHFNADSDLDPDPSFQMKVWWQLPLFLFILSFTITFILTFVQYTYSSPRPLSVFFIVFAQREKPPRGAKPGFELGPAVQQASALPTELCCIQPTELCCTLTALCCTLPNKGSKP